MADDKKAVPTTTAPDKAMDRKAFVKESRGRTDTAALDLLVEACQLFGLDPSQDQRPQELAAWSYYPADEVERVPAAVVLVTSGGLKLKVYDDPDYPMDADTEEKLATILNAFSLNDKKERVRVALPDDLTLPAASVTGRGASQDHVIKGGYLRAGGKKDADRREKARADRDKK